MYKFLILRFIKSIKIEIIAQLMLNENKNLFSFSREFLLHNNFTKYVSNHMNY